MAKPYAPKFEIVSPQIASLLRNFPSSLQLQGEEVPVYRQDSILPDWSRDDLILAGAMSAKQGLALSAFTLSQLLCVETTLKVKHPDSP
jgi:hypothetical protein